MRYRLEIDLPITLGELKQFIQDAEAIGADDRARVGVSMSIPLQVDWHREPIDG